MLMFRPTWWDLVKMLWWSFWSPPKPVAYQLPPMKKRDNIREDRCHTCKRPF
jgi:hypothetical protein